jgi:plastocyanin
VQGVGLSIAAFCLATAPALGAELSGTVHASGKPVQHAVIWLDVAKPPPFTQTSRVTVDQRQLTFLPKVLVVRVGTVVDFPNNDKVFHNVFSFRDGKRFNLGMYPIGTSKRIVFDQPGLARLFCNIHPNMAAYIMAVDTPYFAVSNDRGGFRILEVPAGTYTYHAWRPGGQLLKGLVTIDSTQNRGADGDATEGARSLDLQW